MEEDSIARLAHPRRDIPGEDPAVARLTAATFALLGELVVVRERLDTVERLLEDGGALKAGQVDGFEPSAEQEVARTALRKRQISKVLRPYRDDAARVSAALREAQAIEKADAILSEESPE